MLFHHRAHNLSPRLDHLCFIELIFKVIGMKELADRIAQRLIVGSWHIRCLGGKGTKFTPV
jgi:hypothetical protein